MGDVFRVRPCNSWAFTVAPPDETQEGGTHDMARARRGRSRAAASKTGVYDGTVVIADTVSRQVGRAWIAHLVGALVRGRPPSSPLFGLTLPQYSRALAAALDALALRALDVTPHSVRHGGASKDALDRARGEKEIALRGRWGCLASVARYRKTGTLLRQEALVPEELRVVAGDVWLPRFRAAFASARRRGI